MLLFAVGGMNVWGATQNFVPNDFSGGTSGTGSTVNKTLNGIQVSTDKGYATTQFRVYKGGKLTISSDYTIKAINFTTNSSYGGGLSNQTNLTTTSWSFTTTGQARITQIVVTYLAKVTFNANEGSCATSNLTQATANSSITLPTPTRSGFTCTGWYTASSGGTKRGNAGATYTPAASETLYAQWEPDAPAYTITAARNNASYGNVSLSGTTITATPAACCEYASPAYTVSPAGSATVSQVGNAFTVTPSANTTVTINFQQKSAGKTVNFDAGAGVCATTSLTEDCDGSGVVLPNVTASGVCKGWTTFAGWATSAVSDSTTTSVTLYAAGSKFTPSSDGQTLYAVYSKVKGGGSTEALIKSIGFESSEGFTADNTYNNASANNQGPTGEQWAFIMGTPSTNDAIEGSQSAQMRSYADKTTHGSITMSYDVAKVTKVTFKAKHQTKSSLKLYYSTNSGSSWSTATNQALTTTKTTYTYNISATGEYNNVRVKFENAVESSAGRVYIDSVKIYGMVASNTTYYCSDPNCCTPLAQVNGSANLSQWNAGVHIY